MHSEAAIRYKTNRADLTLNHHLTHDDVKLLKLFFKQYLQCRQEPTQTLYLSLSLSALAGAQ